MDSLLNQAMLFTVQPLCIVLMGAILARIVHRLDIRSVAIPCLLIFFPAYFYVQSVNQIQNAYEPVFTYLLFFYLFHTVTLFWITKGCLYLFKFSVPMHYLSLLFVLIPSVQGLRVIQNSISLQADSNQLISMMIFMEAVIASTLGIYLIHAQKGFTNGIKKVFMTPLLYTVLIGFIFALIKYQPPYEFTSTIDRLYAVTIPLAVILTGMAFGKSVYLIDYNSYIPFLPAALFCTVLRLVISPLLAWGIASMMEIDNTAVMRAVILSAGLPTGIFAMVVTGAFSKQEHHGYAAFVIIFSSIISFLSMPLLIMLVNHFYPLISV